MNEENPKLKIQVQADPFPLSYVAACTGHYILTQPYFKGVIFVNFYHTISVVFCNSAAFQMCYLCYFSYTTLSILTHHPKFVLTQTISAEEHLVTMVSSSKPFLFDCLEFLYVPIILR